MAVQSESRLNGLAVPAVLRNWMGLVDRGGTTALAAGEDVVPACRVRELEQQVKQLQRLVGKQAMPIEIDTLNR